MEQIKGGLDLIWLLFVITHVGQKCLLRVITWWKNDKKDLSAGMFPICL